MKTRKIATHSYRIIKSAKILGLLTLIAGAILLSACPTATTDTIDFEDPSLGTEYHVWDTITEYGITILPFQWGNGQWTFDGYARIDDEGLSGGSGQDINANNVNLLFIFCDPLEEVTLDFGEYGGNCNILINGSPPVNFLNFQDIDGTIIGGVEVSVVNGVGEGTGKLTLTGEIEMFFIGGQELWIDDVSMTE